MTWGQALICAWMAWIAIGMLVIWYNIDRCLRQTKQNDKGLAVIYSLVMHLVLHECPEIYESIKTDIEFSKLAQGLKTKETGDQ